MTAGTSPHGFTALRAVVLAVLYLYMLWHLFKDNPKNKLLRSGSVALMVFFAAMLMAKANVPIEYWWWLGVLLLLLCLLTMLFLFQRMYRAIRKRFATRTRDRFPDRGV
jgi:hypothetical protein